MNEPMLSTGGRLPGAIGKPCPGVGAKEAKASGQPFERGDHGGQAAVRAADAGAGGANARSPLFPQSAGRGQLLALLPSDIVCERLVLMAVLLQDLLFSLKAPEEINSMMLLSFEYVWAS